MKLPTNNQNHIKIPLSCLKITDNVRMNFDEAEIEELANSIRQNGLMNPITVRPPETDADGNKTYEVIAGGRRIRAHQWLCEHGDDFSLIECCIRIGDKWALQMIENIQRTDLTPREKENAVAKALEEGLSQTQIADKLAKPIQWVSDIVAGAKIRKFADAAGLNTEEITTKTLSQLRSIPADKLQNCLKELIAEGGTYRAATRMMQEEKNPATTHVSTPDEDFIPEDESMISPSEMSEEDFHSEIENEQYNIYAIPDNAKAIRKPELSKKNDSDLEEKTTQKGFANPVSKEIQKRWVVFCRDKKIPESDKTAFKFYQELTAYFENTRS